MNSRESFSKRKGHIIFAFAFVSALAFNIIIGLTSSKTIMSATWHAISDIRPMEYLMFGLFWYAFAAHRPKDDWGSSLTTLNLSQSIKPN